MSRSCIAASLAVVALLLLPAIAGAVEQKKLATGFGMSASIGGGVAGFTDEQMTDVTDVAGTWETRIGIGTRKIVGFEAAYIGAAQNIDTLGLDNSAVLVGTGLEGVARVNIGKAMFQPYLLAGLGWKRYDITNESFNTSSISDSDNVMEIPVGAGVNYRYEGLILDLRGVFRPSVDDDLVAKPAGGDRARLHNWSGVLRAGFEF